MRSLDGPITSMTSVRTNLNTAWWQGHGRKTTWSHRGETPSTKYRMPEAIRSWSLEEIHSTALTRKQPCPHLSFGLRAS
jgi:hypothetical protein